MQRKFNIDDSFFDVIDTQEKAYILGLLFADGTIYKDTGVVKIDLAQYDESILSKIKDIMHFDGEIKHYSNENKYFSTTEKEYQCNPTARLLFRSKQLANQIISKGRGIKKDCSVFPSSDIVPNELLNHFIRGYMDGDGGISSWCDNPRTCHQKFSINFCGMTQIIKPISDILDKKFDCTSAITSRFPDRDNNNIQSNICGNRNCKKILDWIYKDATIYIDRKHDKYLELLKEIDRADNDHNLYGNAFPRKQVIRLSDLKIYDSVSKAAKDNNVAPGTITNRCKSHKGFMHYTEYLETQQTA